MAALEMNENRIDAQLASLDSRNMFWSPRWRYVHDKAISNKNTRGRSGTIPAVQLFLDAFPIGDSLAFNSATFIDVYATQLTVPPSKQFDAAVNLYFDLCEMARRDMLVELRAGPADLDVVGQTYAKHRAAITDLGKQFFRDVRQGKDGVAMQRYNKLVVEALGVDNLRIFDVHALFR